jgi:glycogen(starch) synthase
MAMKAHPQARSPTILMTADAVGGVWSYAVGLCTALPEIQFVVATMGPRIQQARRRELAGLDNVLLVESDYRLEWMADGAADLAESRDWLIRLVERHAIDLVHVNGYAHGRLELDCPALVVAHSDVFSWWEAVHKRSAPPEWSRYRERVVAGLAAASRVVAPTAAVLHDIQRRYLLPEGNAAVISNGIDLAAFPCLAKRPVVLGAGRIWDEAKNFGALDAVAPRLAWPVEIAGDAEHPERETAQFPNVSLLGCLNPAEMARHLGHAAIFAAPARYEPFGLAILEAAAAGCALVLGDIEYLRENWDGAAVFVDPEDRSALRSAINRLIAKSNLRQSLARAAQCRARQFTLQRMARSYAALYREMAVSAARLETA